MQDLLNSEIDLDYSGTTCNIVLIIKDEIYCANLGDSRAIVAKNKKLNTWTV